jgi:hypothetical protein
MNKNENSSVSNKYIINSTENFRNNCEKKIRSNGRTSFSLFSLLTVVLSVNKFLRFDLVE